MHWRQSMPKLNVTLCPALVLALVLLLALSAHMAMAEQIVTIDSAVPGGPENVYGNGPGRPYGTSFTGFPPIDLLDPNNNTVNIISGGMVNGDVYGGWSDAPGTSVTGNSVYISGNAQVDGDVIGGYSTFGSVTGNSVTIRGGTVNGQVVGGRSNGDSATGNSVTISGGTVNSDVTGGFSVNGNATYNTVTLSGSPNFINPGGVRLYGGEVLWMGDAFTGNTLSLWNYTQRGTVFTVQSFQLFNFTIPSNPTSPVLTVTGEARLGEWVGGVATGRGSTVTAVNTNGHGTPPMPLGSSVTLIKVLNPGGLFLDGFDQSFTQGKHGATINYLWALGTANDELTATVAQVGAAPETKALSEGYLAGTMLVNQGADLIAGKGMHEAMRSSWKKDGGFGFGVFGAISGGWSKYNTGSHVDMSGLSLMTGLSFGADLAPGRLTLGAFFEYGTGAYDTYNSFASGDSHGKGNLYHLGGGALARMDFIETGPGNIYTEASFRAGGLHNDYRNSDLRDLDGRKANYDSFALYYGIHAGLGYIWKITEAASLDMYGKFFWTRQQGDSVRLSTGDPVKFKDTDSIRTRLGARFAYAVNDYVAPYIGAAWEHEFDGKQKATTYGYDIDKPSLFGSTGIGELGLTLKPSKDLPLSFDLGVQGYVGKRQGVTGSLQAKFEF